MKNKYRILKIFVVVVLLAFLLNFSLNRFNGKKLEDVRIQMIQSEPVQFVSDRDIRGMVKHTNPEMKIGTLDIPGLEKQLRTLPSVDSANVYLNLNGTLNLDIKQRVPVMRVNNGSQNYYVDRDGTEFPLSPHYAHPCMLVSGHIPKDDYKGIVQLIDAINSDKFTKRFFVGIARHNDSYFLLTDDGNYKVELGGLERPAYKLKGFKTFLEKYLVYQNPQKYSKVSLRFDNQIVTTLRKGFTSELDSLMKQPIVNEIAPGMGAD